MQSVHKDANKSHQIFSVAILSQVASLGLMGVWHEYIPPHSYSLRALFQKTKQNKCSYVDTTGYLLHLLNYMWTHGSL